MKGVLIIIDTPLLISDHPIGITNYPLIYIVC